MSKSTNPSVAQPIVTVPEDSPKATGFFKLSNTPRGTKLYNYTCGIFMAMGLWNAKGKVFQKADLTRFYRTDSVIRHHIGAGNLEETKTGIKMTKAGWQYFNGRLTGSNVGKRVNVPEAEALAKAIKSGKLDKATANFPKSTTFTAITE